MSTDVIARLAAANPVPSAAAVRRQRVPARRLALALAVAAAVAAPTIAFAGRLADILGISNGGTPVSTSRVLPGESALDQALAELEVGSTMQSLGTLDGVSFYATRNAAGHFCLVINGPDDKGFGCDLNADGFPSTSTRAFVFPPGLRLQGVAADGVATVEYLDANGAVVDSAPVTNNLFVSGKRLAAGQAVYVATLDANGNVTSKRALR